MKWSRIAILIFFFPISLLFYALAREWFEEEDNDHDDNVPKNVKDKIDKRNREIDEWIKQQKEYF